MSLSINTISNKILAVYRDLDKASSLFKKQPINIEKIIEMLPCLQEDYSSILKMQRQVAKENSQELKDSSENLRIVLKKCEKLYNKCLAIEQKVQALLALTPSEVWRYIFLHTDLRTIGNVSKVCKRWHAMTKDNYFWRQCLHRDFPNFNIQEGLLFKLQYANAVTESHLSQGKYSTFKMEIDSSNPLICVREKTLVRAIKNNQQKSALCVSEWTRTPTCLHKGIDILVDQSENLQVQLNKDHLFIGTSTPASLCLKIYDKIQEELLLKQSLRLPSGDYLATDDAIFNMVGSRIRCYKKDLNTGDFVKTPQLLVASNYSHSLGTCIAFQGDLCAAGFNTNGEGHTYVWKKDVTGNFPQKEEQRLTYITGIRDIAIHDNVLFVLLHDRSLRLHARDSTTGLFSKIPLLKLENGCTCFTLHRHFLIVGMAFGKIDIWEKDVAGKFHYKRSLQPHSSAITSLKMEDNHLFTTSSEGLKILRFGPAEGELFEDPSLSAKQSEGSSKNKRLFSN